MTRRQGIEQSRIRVAVWGVGMFGSLFIRLMKNQRQLQLVAAFSYGAAKIGKDAGEVSGVGTLGVAITNDPRALIDTWPDCVIYLPRDNGSYSTDAEIIQLLESGCNVITALPYCNLKWRGEEVEKRFDEAAKRGGVTFLATGIDPDYIWERQLLTISGLCAEIERIHIKEIFRGETMGTEMFSFFGFGLPVDEVRQDRRLVELVRNYMEPSMRFACEQMGRPLDRVETTVLSTAAGEDIVLPQFTVKAGTVGLSLVRIQGWIGRESFAIHDIIYYLTDVTRPPETVGDECWVLAIEGKPSVRVTIEALASVEKATYRYPGDPNTPAGYYICAGPVFRAIPLVLAAAAGVKEPVVPEMHWKAN